MTKPHINVDPKNGVELHVPIVPRVCNVSNSDVSNFAVL